MLKIQKMVTNWHGTTNPCFYLKKFGKFIFLIPRLKGSISNFFFFFEKSYHVERFYFEIWKYLSRWINYNHWIILIWKMHKIRDESVDSEYRLYSFLIFSFHLSNWKIHEKSEIIFYDYFIIRKSMKRFSWTLHDLFFQIIINWTEIKIFCVKNLLK